MIIIPARLQSTRFPQKVLCDIGGEPMVVRSAKNAMRVDDVIVACDDLAIESVCKAHNIKAIMTAKSHTSGTDRCAEVAKKLELPKDEIVINIQADEPFLESSTIVALQDLMKAKRPFIGTLAKVISPNDINDSNLVKVVLNEKEEAIYFSRAPVPFMRDVESSQILGSYPYLGHLGLYGFSAETLLEFCALSKSPLEEIEKLEQLRALYHNKTIALKVVETSSIGIDTESDLQLALKRLANL